MVPYQWIIYFLPTNHWENWHIDVPAKARIKHTSLNCTYIRLSKESLYGALYCTLLARLEDNKAMSSSNEGLCPSRAICQHPCAPSYAAGTLVIFFALAPQSPPLDLTTRFGSLSVALSIIEPACLIMPPIDKACTWILF